MSSNLVEYTIYNNLFKYLEIIKFHHIDNKRRDKKDFIKTLQFYSYVFVKAKNDNDETLYAFIVNNNVLLSKSIEFKKLLNIIQEKEVHLVIISADGLKTPVKKFLSKYTKKKMHIKDLRYDHFKMDPRKNILVPKHIICTEEETRKIMNDNKIDHVGLFPKIKSTDVQVLWSGGNVGQLIKIERNTTVGKILYYRAII